MRLWAVAADLDGEDVVEEGEDDISDQAGEGGEGKAQPSYLSGEVGEVVLDLGVEEGGGELQVETLRGDISEAVGRDTREAEDLDQEVRGVLVQRWGILGISSRPGGRPAWPIGPEP